MEIALYDPHLNFDEELGQRAIDWKTNRPLGVEKLPYSFSEYENENRIILNLQTKNIFCYDFFVAKNDTGRILRIQLKDGQQAIDLEDYNIYIDCIAEDEEELRTEYDISEYITDAKNGMIEYVLDADYETYQSNYLVISMKKDGTKTYFPERIHIIVHDHSEEPEILRTSSREITLRNNTEGQSVYINIFQKQNALNNNFTEIDMDNIASAKIYVKKYKGTEPAIGIILTKEKKKFSFLIQKSITTEKGYYIAYIELTTKAGKKIKTPTAGWILAEVI